MIAADLIDLKGYDAGKDQQFRSWLAAVRFATLDGQTLISTHEKFGRTTGAPTPAPAGSPPTRTLAT